jgi:hypothetical protein
MRIPSRIVVLAALLTAPFLLAPADAATGASISGTLSSTTGAPSNAKVAAYVGDEIRVQTLSAIDGTFTLAGLDAGTYVVCAWRSNLIKRCTGDVGGPASYTVAADDVVTGADIAFVGRPENLRVSDTGRNRIRWTWDAVPGAKMYRVTLSAWPTMKNPRFGYAFNTRTWLTFTGLEPDRTYYAAVRGYDYGVPEYGADVLTVPSAIRSAKTHVIASLRGGTLATGTIDWTWAPYVSVVGDDRRALYVDTYELRLSSLASFAAYRSRIVTSPAVSFDDLVPGRTYYAKVRPIAVPGGVVAGWSPVAQGIAGDFG